MPSLSAARLLAADAETRVRFRPNANWYGTVSAGIRFRAWDRTNFGNGDEVTMTAAGGSAPFSLASETASITVTPVNDPPAFVDGADQTVGENAGPQTVTHWATGVAAGPANEANQTLSFVVVSNSNPALFAAGPAVDPLTGNLSYTPAANTYGAVTIELILMDNGGTAGGGKKHLVAARVVPRRTRPSFLGGREKRNGRVGHTSPAPSRCARTRSDQLGRAFPG